MTRCRTSGVCIGGSGSEMSSKAMVSRMPGRSSSGSGSMPTGSVSACAMAASTLRMAGSESGG